MMNEKRINGAYSIDRREEVQLFNSVFHQLCSEELKEIDKHEIIIKICDILGGEPEHLCKAEAVFDRMKFDMACYVLHHECCKEMGIRSRLLLWLDSKINPEKVRRLSRFISQYLD